MNTEDLFTELFEHLQKGLKIHNQLMIIYDFLNLKGYKKCQEYRFLEESYNYIKIKDFYMNNYNKMILIKDKEIEDIIPSTWYKHIKKDVDISTKRNAIKDMMKIWVDWEEETKSLLAKSYKELYDLNDICASSIILKYLNEVFQELTEAKEWQINLESHGYDLSVIITEQESLYKKYKKKIKKIYEDDE